MKASLLMDVVCKDIDQNPHCFHGPTLLFRRRCSSDEGYYACSASRDKKECSFYLRTSDKNLKQSQRAIKRRKTAVGGISYKKLAILRNLLLKLPLKERGFCHTCNGLFQVKQNHEHIKCLTKVGVTKKQIKYPTLICKPKENDKLEAQYLFSADTASFLVQTVTSIGAQRVICIGTPRLHELLINETSIPSLLLDIDSKYVNFYTSKQFIWYNMFNNFVMDEKRIVSLKKFLHSSDKIIVLLDPPFGGRVEPLAETLRKLKNEYNYDKSMERELGVLWFFPYFMERHILNSLPEFHMLDYQVNYENHHAFNDVGPRRRKAGSPVRIFTNVPMNLFDMSHVPGYRYCDLCGYWVSESNSHCSQCKRCTSKNGMRYVHCDVCQICVKPSYVHCQMCGRCCLPSHVCGEFQPDNRCYHCHLPGHKKSRCPKIVQLHKC